MPENKVKSTELREGFDIHPRHESWARITAHNSFIGFVIFLALVALFALVISQHFSPVALAVVGVSAVMTLIWTIWTSVQQHRRGFLGDAGLTFRIKADIVTKLGANDVNVDSAKGVVTLHGSVPYANFAEAAEELARQQGAHKVINELKVVFSAPEQPDAYLQSFAGVTAPAGAPEVTVELPSEELVREALKGDPRVNVHAIVVRVENGIAFLAGRQETVQASDAATEVAAHVPGILGVANDIEIMPSF